jgi:hypothetical protein
LAKTLQINGFTYPYGSEVWLADYNLNFDKLDKLPFEKTQNMIFFKIFLVFTIKLPILLYIPN